MKGSPFAKEFRTEIEVFEEKLMRTQTNLEIWLKLQSVWMYLEPVFKSDDIIKQMPAYGAMFREVDKAWDKLMRQV
jgi:dynein heavy chain